MAKVRMKRWLGMVGIVVGILLSLTAVFVSQSFAEGILTDEQEAEYSMNNILFYNPCTGGGAGSTTACDITVSGSTIEEKIWSGLTSFLTEEQAAGAMGNMAHEGGFNPARHETSWLNSSPNFPIATNTSQSYGIGLIQWSFGRRVELYELINESSPDLWKTYIDEGRETYGRLSGKDFLEKAGDNVTDSLLALELCRLKQELNKDRYKGFLDQKTIKDASNYFLEKVEVPADIASQRPIRLADAERYYAEFHGKTITGSSGGAGSATDPACNSDNEGSKNINGAAVALAWPLGTDKKVYNYQQANGLQSKPAYYNIAKWTGGKATDAFNSALDKFYPEHKSWSQCPSIGASCDVFVGTSVRYSGYDPEWPRGLSEQVAHVNSHSDLWELLEGKGLEPMAGDVVNTGGHTYIVVQDENGDFYRAEAGLCHTFGVISRKFNGFESNAKVFRAKSANNSTSGISVTSGVKSSSTTGVVSDSTTGNHDIGASALYFAWPYKEFKNEMKPESKDAWLKMAKENNVQVTSHVEEGASCVVFVWGTLRYSGLISNFKISERLDQQLEEEPDWNKVAEGDLKEEDLQDGDVLIYRCSRHGSSNYPCHYGLFVEKDGEGYTVEASNPSGCNSDNAGCGYQYPHVSRKGLAGFWSEAWRNSKNKTGSYCNVCGGGDNSEAGLKAGGMTLSEAQEWIKQYHDAAMGTYYRKRGDISFQGADIYDAGCPFGVMNNCVALSQWFINKYTTIGPNWNNTTNGVGMADKLVSSKNLEGGKQPRPYAIFSKAGPSAAGHTGVVLGVDTDAKKIVVGEASCSSSGVLAYPPSVREYSFNDIKSWNYAYTDNVLKGGMGGA